MNAFSTNIYKTMCDTFSDKKSREIIQLSTPCCCIKWFWCTCGIFLLTCILSIACCVLCVNVLNTVKELRLTCKSEGKLHSKDFEKSGEGTQVNQGNTDKLNPNELTLRIKRAAKKKSKQQILAGHYAQKPSKDYFTNTLEYNHSQMISTCKYVDDLKGSLCKTGDFISDTNILQVFKPVGPLKAKTSPFRSIKNGKFIVRKKGIYLVYAQVLFYDKKDFQQMKVTQWKRDNVVNEYACIRSVRGIDWKVNNTCSLTAIFFLNKGEYLTVQLFEKDLTLNFLQSNTFFGAIFLK